MQRVQIINKKEKEYDDMDFYDVIENRKSIRLFKTNSIEKGKINRMIKAAMMAPSWKNHTSYKFIIVDDKKIKNKLADTIMNDSDFTADAVKKAPLLAVVAADPDESGEVSGKEYYLVDSAIAMEHFVLAATAEGYGTCWVGAFNEREARTILNIPDNFRVVAMTPVGEIEEDKEHFPPKNTGDIIYENRWDNSFLN